MNKSKTPQQCFEELKNVILAIDDDTVVRRTMPYEEACRKECGHTLVEKYYDKLLSSGIDSVYVDTIYEGQQHSPTAWGLLL